MIVRNYKTIKESSNNMKMILYAAVLQALVGVALLFMNMIEAIDIPLYAPMMLITSAALISKAAICECKDDTNK
jgi:hypothetical protein